MKIRNIIIPSLILFLPTQLALVGGVPVDVKGLICFFLVLVTFFSVIEAIRYLLKKIFIYWKNKKSEGQKNE